MKDYKSFIQELFLKQMKELTLNSVGDNDIYTEEGLADQLENDEISAGEESFMISYLAS